MKTSFKWLWLTHVLIESKAWTFASFSGALISPGRPKEKRSEATLLSRRARMERSGAIEKGAGDRQLDFWGVRPNASHTGVTIF